MRIAIVLFVAICCVKATQLELGAFSWKNCGPSNAITVESLSLEPDPIVIPGTAVLNVVVDVPVEIKSPTELSIQIQKKLDNVWFDVPCLDHIGSCTYSDICVVLNEIFGDDTKECPKILIDHGIPCHCPFHAGKYVVKDFTVNIDKTPLPPTLLAGDYHVKYELKGTDKEGRDGICMDLYASIRAK